MYKLIGHSLQRGAWFEPESQPMTLIERNSNSSITLGPDTPEIGFNDWLLDDGWPEGPTIWRVKAIDNQTDTETVTVSLEHVIRTLEDPKLFEDVETGDIAGGETCTSRQAIGVLSLLPQRILPSLRSCSGTGRAGEPGLSQMP